MRNTRFILAAAALSFGVVACGGGSGTSTNTLPAASNSALQSVSVQFNIKIPASLQRSPKYISPSTASASIVITPTGGTALAAQTIACGTSACSGTVNAPVGSDQFDVRLLDSGSHGLSEGILTQTITAGIANNVNLTFNGIIASVAVSASSGNITLGTPQTIPITVTAKDADGNTIAGTYSSAIALAVTGTTAIHVAPTSLTSSTTSVSISYDGTSFTNASVTATAGSINGTPLALTGVSGGTISPAAFMTQTSSTKVNGSIGAGKISAIGVAISELSDPAVTGPGGSFTTGTLNVGTGSSSQSVIRVPQEHQAAPRTSARRAIPVEAYSAAAFGATIKRIASLPRGTNSGNIRNSSGVLPTPPYVAGTTSANIWVAAFGLGTGGGNYASVPATFEAQTAHGNIWIDNSLISGAHSSTQFAPGALSATVTGISNDFENAYTSDTTHFGTPDYSASAPGNQITNYPECNPGSTTPNGSSEAQYIAEPSDKRINVMVVNPANLGNEVGGYFDSGNYVPQAILNCLGTGSNAVYSNEAPFFYVGWFDQSDGGSFELKEDLVRGTGHEFQHLVNFVNHSLLTTAGEEDSFINEGLSMLAQDLAVNNKYPSQAFDVDDAMLHATAYLGAPQNYNVPGFIGIDSAAPFFTSGTPTAKYNCGGGCYGSAYLFQRYMRDRFGGDAYTQAMETSGLTGFAELSHNATGVSETGQKLLGDFAVAMATSSAGITQGDARFNFGTLNLLGTYNDTAGTGQGETFTLTGVSMVAAPVNLLTAITPPIGGFEFLNLTGIPSVGEPVSIVDTSGGGSFGLVGGLVQH